jgi:two-component system, chemotaxis family, protein-glutamate methylesterase/glutaminase
MTTKKIRVLIVEDSRVVREFLQCVIDHDPRLVVAAAVGSAEEALSLLPRLSPDVISMDIRLPGMNGFEATQRIMAEKPTPIVVVSSSVEAEDLKISMNALRAGALTVLEKPVGASHASYEMLAERLCTQLVIMSQVKVIRQYRGRSPRLGREPISKPSPATSCGPWRVLGVAASTGGPNALASLLGELPSTFPLPILLVQHITNSFLGGFVSWLNDICPLSVKLAQEGAIPAAGDVLVPPPDHHLLLQGGRVRLNRAEMVCLQRPSGTVLFESMAQSLGPQALGVLLTGMGEDGADGLLKIRQAGGYTLAEDESTAVVYGMPAAAVRLGAVCESLPLPAIAPRLLELLSLRREVC